MTEAKLQVKKKQEKTDFKCSVIHNFRTKFKTCWTDQYQTVIFHLDHGEEYLNW